MSTKDIEHFRNFTETLVDDVIEKLLNEITDVCTCEKCKCDIKAIALNNLPPKYIVTDIGEVYTKLDSFKNQVQVDLLKEVLNAIEIVKERPSHAIII